LRNGECSILRLRRFYNLWFNYESKFVKNVCWSCQNFVASRSWRKGLWGRVKMQDRKMTDQIRVLQ